MRKNFTAIAAAALALGVGSAVAADLPSRKAPAYLPPPPPPWTGFYAGLNAGGTFGADDGVTVGNGALYATPFPAPALAQSSALAASAAGTFGPLSTNNGGFIGGGQVGYNYQLGSAGLNAFLVGIEADIQGIAGSNSSVSAFGAAPMPLVGPGFNVFSATQATRQLDYLGTVRGRLGFLVTQTLLLYGTGGLAYGGVSSSTSVLQGFSAFTGPTGQAWGAAGSYSDTRVGWTAGGGVEWMFMPNWSAKVEYLYCDLGTVSYSSGVTGSFLTGTGAPLFLNGVTTSTRFNGHIVRVGVNYHFNLGAPAPVLAKY